MKSLGFRIVIGGFWQGILELHQSFYECNNLLISERPVVWLVETGKPHSKHWHAFDQTGRQRPNVRPSIFPNAIAKRHDNFTMIATIGTQPFLTVLRQ